MGVHEVGGKGREIWVSVTLRALMRIWMSMWDYRGVCNLMYGKTFTHTYITMFALFIKKKKTETWGFGILLLGAANCNV